MSDWDDALKGRIARELIGGFACRITVEEINDWREYAIQTVEFKRLETANREVNALDMSGGSLDECRVACLEQELATRALFVVGKLWYAGLLERRAKDEATGVTERA